MITLGTVAGIVLVAGSVPFHPAAAPSEYLPEPKPVVREVAIAQEALPKPPPPPSTNPASVWDRLAECESHGNWSINTGNGYYGGLQFSLKSWQWVGGAGYPHQASKAEQIARAEILLDRQGWRAWPACSRKLGLR